METVRGETDVISVDLLSPTGITGRAETEFSLDLTDKLGRIVALIKDVSPFWEQAGPVIAGTCASDGPDTSSAPPFAAVTSRATAREPGLDFAEVILEAMDSCAVLMSVAVVTDPKI